MGGMIRLCRQMMVAAADKEAEFWSKMKQLEVQFYQMKSASADTAASLRDWVTAAFQTMNEIDLNAIGGSPTRWWTSRERTRPKHFQVYNHTYLLHPAYSSTTVLSCISYTTSNIDSALQKSQCCKDQD